MMSFIAQTDGSKADSVGLASCIAIQHNQGGAARRQKKGVIREENYYVRCVTQSGFNSLGEVGS
jgi:hypothetical protein